MFRRILLLLMVAVVMAASAAPAFALPDQERFFPNVPNEAGPTSDAFFGLQTAVDAIPNTTPTNTPSTGDIVVVKVKDKSSSGPIL